MCAGTNFGTVSATSTIATLLAVAVPIFAKNAHINESEAAVEITNHML